MALEKAEILSFIFGGTDYAISHFHFQFLVEERGLWGYVDGTEVQLDNKDLKKVRQWKIANSKIVVGF